MSEKPPDSAFLDSIDKTLGAAKDKAFQAKKSYDQSDIGKAQRDLTALGRFWHQFLRSVGWIYMTLIAPVTWRLYRGLLWLFRKYRDFWHHCVYAKDQYGDPQFSKKRGGLFILATIAVLYVCYGIAMVASTIPWYEATVLRDEEVYLSNSQPRHGNFDVYEIQGCESMPCTDQNSLTFEARVTWFNEFWSIFHNGSLFYPGYIAGAVPPVISRCVITSYGTRRRFLVTQLELNAHIIQVKKCQPIEAEGENGDKGIHNRDYRR
jgi:hypothetical protein